TEFPTPEQFVGVRFDILTFERGNRGNGNLNAGLRFKLSELLFNCYTGCRLNNIRLIDDTARQGRKVKGEARGDRKRQRHSNDRLTSPSSTRGGSGSARNHLDAFISRRPVRISLAAACPHSHSRRIRPSVCCRGRRYWPKECQGMSGVLCCIVAPLQCSRV